MDMKNSHARKKKIKSEKFIKIPDIALVTK